MKKALASIGAVIVIYLALAYGLVPLLWDRYAHHHPSFDDNPRLTETADYHLGDPLNVALIGTKDDVNSIMASARWYGANPQGIRNDLEIASDTVFRRPDDNGWIRFSRAAARF